MLPMVTELGEIAQAREIIDREVRHLSRFAHHLPTSLKLGAMLEVPSLLWQLDELMKAVDFVSVGSNDLFQFVMAADRGNTQLADRFDPLSVPFLRVLKQIADAGVRNHTPVTLCGELAGKPISAMALIGLGYRSISMSPASIGPVKAMLTELPLDELAGLLRRQSDGAGAGAADAGAAAGLCRRPLDPAIALSHGQSSPRPYGPGRQAFRHARSADVGRAGGRTPM